MTWLPAWDSFIKVVETGSHDELLARDGDALSYRFYDAASEKILIFIHGSSYHGAGYHDLERASNGLKDKEYAVGLGYGVGAFDFKGNYLVADPAGADNKFEQFNLGFSFGFGPGRLLANLQQSRFEGGAKGTVLATTYSHELSKRTNLYASYARLSNNATGSFGISSSGTSVAPASSSPGADPSVLAIGVRHRF